MLPPLDRSPSPWALKSMEVWMEFCAGKIDSKGVTSRLVDFTYKHLDCYHPETEPPPPSDPAVNQYLSLTKREQEQTPPDSREYLEGKLYPWRMRCRDAQLANIRNQNWLGIMLKEFRERGAVVEKNRVAEILEEYP